MLLKQLTNETEKRPVIKKVNPSELLVFIQNKLEEREPYYSKADFTINIDDLHENSLSPFLFETK